MGGFLPVPGQTIYGASNAAVKLFTYGFYLSVQPATGGKLYFQADEITLAGINPISEC
jgi:hypothetical protein